MFSLERPRHSPRISRRGVAVKNTNSEIGSGTFGRVYMNTMDGVPYAVKAFTLGKELVHLTTLREIKAMRAIKSRYVLGIREIVVDGQHITLVLPYYQYDLYRILSEVRFTLKEIRHVFWQILRGVEAIHRSGYLHRDIKSANILVNVRTAHGGNDECQNRHCNEPDDYEDIKYRGTESQYQACICDFGMARTRGKCMTPETVTLWYRSPEILLGSTTYTETADMWSLGCILLEMLTGQPLFKASTEVEALDMVVGLCGSITEESLPGCTDMPLYNSYRLKEARRCVLEKFSVISADAADLADQLLELNPRMRITLNECFDHPFFVFDS